ncbi:hypothetical protein PR048_010402 [Dryococelus australis]|uniref:Uncharacterized protein n=1 Tax=Dryococelus australis TaxID=614101 RepID=A0ABQ9I2N5_9NEOP|nr:hypothetical protein PR048_010402 [Dryococelus australis]
MEEHNIFPNAILLRDSAYPLKKWLMILLYHDPDNEVESRDQGDDIVIPVNEEAVELEENDVGPHEYRGVVENEVQYVGGRVRSQQIL